MREEEFAAQILMNFFPDEPCNYNGMDERAACEYCEDNCDDHDTFDCWVHAIEAGWYLPRREE